MRGLQKLIGKNTEGVSLSENQVHEDDRDDVQIRSCPRCGIKDYRRFDNWGSLNVVRKIGMVCNNCGYRVSRDWNGSGDISKQDQLINQAWNEGL